MASTSKKYKSREYFVSLFAFWILAISAIILLFCSLNAAELDKVINLKKQAVPNNLKWGNQHLS